MSDNTPKMDDRVNLIGFVEAGRPDYVNMVVISDPWTLGHGVQVIRCRRPSGKADTFPTSNLVVTTKAGA